MKKLEMIIRPEKLEDVKETLNQMEIYGMTVTMVSGCGHQKGRREMYRGSEISINLLPKVKVETVVKDNVVDELIKKITALIQTGAVGDGKIFIYSVEDAVRIRTGERGENAL
jgi:nitrogen regulatory protein PII